MISGQTPSISLSDVDLTVVVVPMRMTFRRINWREAVLVEGPAGWGEFSPFSEYPPEVTARWLAAALEWACVPMQAPTEAEVAVNVTVPAVDPETARRLVIQSGCSTAKVKVANPGDSFDDDLARVGAVRDALGSQGFLRIDVNGAWGVDEAVAKLRDLSAFDLQYAEQPVASISEMVELRKRTDVLVAADEVIRQRADPMEVVEAGAADVLVLKVQPLGGLQRTLDLASRTELPIVISSALETSIGLSQGVAAAARIGPAHPLHGAPLAHGLGTGALLAGDVVRNPLIPHEGVVSTRRPEPDPDLIEHWQADSRTRSAALQRFREAAELLT